MRSIAIIDCVFGDRRQRFGLLFSWPWGALAGHGDIVELGDRNLTVQRYKFVTSKGPTVEFHFTDLICKSEVEYEAACEKFLNDRWERMA